PPTPPDLHSFPTRRSSDLFQRQIEGAAPLAQTHQRLINGDSRNPGGQARTTFELAKLAMHFEQRLLLHIFSVLSIAPNAQSQAIDRKSTRLNSSHVAISYA